MRQAITNFLSEYIFGEGFFSFKIFRKFLPKKNQRAIIQNVCFLNHHLNFKLIVFISGGLLFFVSSNNLIGQALPCSECDIVLNGDYQQNGDNYDYQPGDTIGIDADVTNSSIDLFNWHGKKGKPITFINCNGKVVIDASTIGIGIYDNSHFRITGIGDPNEKYGILIKGYKNTGIQIRNGINNNFEMDHIETVGGKLGWHVTNQFKCDKPNSWKENFIMRNVSIHDTYTHDNSGEGYYIGYSNDKTITCDGDVKEPMKIRNIRFYNNKSKDTGWDGMQIGNADSAVYVYNNRIVNYGLEGKATQDDGMVVNNNATGEWFNNVIINGKGGGISVIGHGNIKLYNNVIVDAGEFGIFIGDRAEPDKNFKTYNNTIIEPGNDGILMYSDNTAGNEIFNNLIVDKESNFISADGVDVSISNNLKFTDQSKGDFVNPAENNYRLNKNSPAVDSGKDVSNEGVIIDADSLRRPEGGAFDVGAYEYGGVINKKPNLYTVGNQVVQINSSLDTLLKASDPDGDAITFKSSGLPSFASITKQNDSTALLNISPGENDAGIYDNITIKVVDSTGGFTEELICITVKDPNNEDPSISAVKKDTVIIGDTLNIDVHASDPNGDSIDLSVNSIPNFFNFNLKENNSGIFTIFPSAGDKGIYKPEIIATDGKGGVDTFQITVIVKNIAFPDSSSNSIKIGAGFNENKNGFVYEDDAFRNTNQPDYADGFYDGKNGYEGGSLKVSLGGLNDSNVSEISGGWYKEFSLDTATELTLTLRFKLVTNVYDNDEYGEVMVRVDDKIYGKNGNEYLARKYADGDTDWQVYQVNLGKLDAGKHKLYLGGYNNQKTYNEELTEIWFDDVWITGSENEDQIITNVDENPNSYDLQLSLFPNPANNFINLEIENLPSNEIDIEIFDVNGKRLAHKNIYTSFDKNRIRLNIGEMNLYPGLYFIKVHSDGKTSKTFRLIKK